MDLPGPIHEILVLFGGFVLLLGGRAIAQFGRATRLHVRQCFSRELIMQ